MENESLIISLLILRRERQTLGNKPFFHLLNKEGIYFKNRLRKIAPVITYVNIQGKKCLNAVLVNAICTAEQNYQV